MHVKVARWVPLNIIIPNIITALLKLALSFQKQPILLNREFWREKKCNILIAGKGHMNAAQDFWLSNVFWNNLLWFFGRTLFIVQVKFFTVNKTVSCRYWKYLPCQIPQEWKPSSWLNNETEIIPTKCLTAGGEISRILYDPKWNCFIE